MLSVFRTDFEVVREGRNMSKLPIIKEANLASLIYFIRGEKVMPDTDLAKLFNVETRVLKQAVRRNLDRFPKDFMLELTDEEIDGMVSQGVIPSKQLFGGAKPFAFSTNAPGRK